MAPQEGYEEVWGPDISHVFNFVTYNSTKGKNSKKTNIVSADSLEGKTSKCPTEYSGILGKLDSGKCVIRKATQGLNT